MINMELDLLLLLKPAWWMPFSDFNDVETNFMVNDLIRLNAI